MRVTTAPRSEQTAKTAKTAEESVDPRLWRMAGVLIFGAILSLLDATIVSVGIGSVGRELHSSLGAVQWVSTGYLLAVAMVMPLSGWASERFGARRTWITSVALFVLGSALCGLAWSVPSLIAFRVLQGVGGGMMQPVGQAMLAQEAGPTRMARILSVVSLPMTFAPILGPLLGGLIVQDLDWRWMFFVNIPVGLGTLVAAARILPRRPRSAAGSRLDLRGLLLLSPALAALVYGFAAAGDEGGFGSVRVLAFLCVGAALLAGYAVHALRGRGVPLIDLRLFARRGFSVASGSSFLTGASLHSSMLLIPLYYQQVLHYSPLAAGLVALPMALCTALSTFLAGRLGSRLSPRGFMVTGVTLAVLGSVAFTQLAAQPASWLLLGSLALRGIGTGLTMAPGLGLLYGSVGREQAPRAAGAVNVLNRVGGSLGTAILVVVLEQSARTAASPAAAFGTTFGWALGLSSLALVPALLFPGRRRTA